MRASVKVKLILILMVIALSVYLLFPTLQLVRMDNAEKEALEIQNPKELMNLKSRSVNLGLDLQGGMHVVLEVDIKELLNQIAKNKNDVFDRSLEKTACRS